jgi:putative oxidoreductase
MNFMGLSGPVSLSLTIFAELVCAGLVALGLFTRLATVPLIILTLVIIFIAHQGDIFDTASSGFFYLLAYAVIFLLGPGKYSIDYSINKKRK